MPERNEEMSLREALVNAVSAPSAEEPIAEGGEQPVESGAAAAEMNTPAAEEPAAEPVAEPVAAPAAAQNPAEQQNPAQHTAAPSQIDMWNAMRQLVEENRRVSEENRQLNAAMQQRNAQVAQQNEAMHQQSQAAEGAIMNQFTPAAAVPQTAAPEVTAPPVLNIQELSYLSPEEQQVKLTQWQTAITEHAVRQAAAQLRNEIERDIAPVKEDWEAKRRIAANDAAKATLFSMPQFADMKEKEGDIERIIAGTPILNGASPEQKYVLAALISRGMNSSHQPTTEDLINMAKSNPDVMKALEAQRVAEIQRNNESLPKVVPSSGLGNANAVPESKPQTSEDFRELMKRKLFGR